MFVKGASDIITVTPTVQAAAYAAGNSIGGKITLANVSLESSSTSILESLVALVKSGASADITALFFDGTIASTITDKATPTISAADMANCLGAVAIAAADFVAVGTPVLATKTGLGLAVKPSKTVLPENRKNLTLVLLAGGAITFGSTTDLQIKLGVLQG